MARQLHKPDSDRIERLGRALELLTDSERDKIEAELSTFLEQSVEQLERQILAGRSLLLTGLTPAQCEKVREIYFPGTRGRPKRSDIPAWVFEEMDRRCPPRGKEKPTTVAKGLAERERHTGAKVGTVKARADHFVKERRRRKNSRRN